MIMPGKHLSMSRSLLGRGARIIQAIEQPRPVSSVWDRLRGEEGFEDFDDFVLALSLTYSLGALHLRNGRLHRGPGT
jgi:hypothetical protein